MGLGWIFEIILLTTLAFGLGLTSTEQPPLPPSSFLPEINVIWINGWMDGWMDTNFHPTNPNPKRMHCRFVPVHSEIRA
ncbi:hypothetical protein BO70DRAFT_360340 [Aspergillus heteromorphus CBS 117.55]|uniref:Uncharacterized protein n=1 Tax=Aspergillus heteromorphus CBS 117.55 TaxID=1448321 RepID=A0A317WTZ5_9EURO|nr:uncharacterized protein BO70DRAFT_360340 [Aspergillus heteromorphus CBS 117.55]PWY87700.1 hypothetical protein BO70DRAFT_360340 [Aspergillus heteromorphus CBS 117.55]